MTLPALDQLLDICAKATPGPWHAKFNDDRDLNVVLIYDGSPIAACDAHCAADANHIATYHPQLVTALINVAKAAETLHKAQVGVTMPMELYDSWFQSKEALAALAKALPQGERG